MRRRFPGRVAALTLLGMMLSGCVTGPGQHALLGAASVAELADVPFFPQDDYQCGPAALATVLVHEGIAVTPEQLVSKVYVPDRQGSLQAELLAATRSHGRVPYRLPPSPVSMLEEVRDGRPVLLLQNLGFERWPIWHYAVLIGFDAEKQTFLLRSGTVARHKVSSRRFLSSWERGGDWAFVAASPSEPPAGADALGWLRAVAPFESTGDLAIAAEGYAAGVKRWPEDPLVWTALGNVKYLQQDFAAAEQAYAEALARNPDHWPARNNLVWAQMARGCVDAARGWIDGAGPPPEDFAATWKRTLEELASAGERVDAAQACL
ncbi:MAG: PA2778 family cysteine peptidase [Gammaproteobacteria bacterium]|nr:PA2778 family cysteine peptidase [Gammaproteobacteria bacterium]